MMSMSTFLLLIHLCIDFVAAMIIMYRATYGKKR